MEVCKEELCESNEIHEDLLKIVDETLPEETELYDLAELFKVFGDSTRIRILFVLFEAEVCVCDLAKALNMTQSAISHQLRILKQNKLVKSRREGKSIFYSLFGSFFSCHSPIIINIFWHFCRRCQYGYFIMFNLHKSTSYIDKPFASI